MSAKTASPSPSVSAPDKPFTPPRAELYETVCWYQDADRNKLPLRAIVNSCSPAGVCSLEVKFGDTAKGMGSVRHLDDPFLKTNDKARKSYGGWAPLATARRWLREVEENEAAALQRQRDADALHKEKVANEKERRMPEAVELFKKGWTVPKIALSLTQGSVEFTPEDVKTALRKEGLIQ